MELNFRTNDDNTVLRVKSDTETDFKGHTIVETPKSGITVTDTFDVIEKTDHKEDAESSYDWYLVKNHYRTQERFTAETEEAVNVALEDHASKLDYIAMMADIDIEEV